MKNVLENNKLIAEFMEMQKTSIGWFDNESTLDLPNTMDNTFDFLLFNSSWNWLMPVVEKISITDWHGGSTDVLSTWTTRPFAFEIASAYSQVVIECNVGQTKNFFNFHNKGKNMITNTYVVVVEFIKWYNLNK